MRKIFVKNLISMSLVVALIIGSSFQVFALSETKTPAKAGEVVYNGFLIDSNCGVKGYDAIHKIDLKKSPEKHTTECMKMKECMGSGLGLSIQQGNGTYKFFKFDTASSKLADDKIMMMTKKASDIMVTVKGVLKGDIITASSIAETPEYIGFLIDSRCGVKGYDDIHKIDLKKSPEKHTTECMKMKECMGSGLGLSIKQANGTYKFTKFDTAGSKLADDKIMMMTKKKFNNKVAAKVNLNGDTFNLVTIKEAQ